MIKIKETRTLKISQKDHERLLTCISIVECILRAPGNRETQIACNTLIIEWPGFFEDLGPRILSNLGKKIIRTKI
jgi:hypothetical protein